MLSRALRRPKRETRSARPEHWLSNVRKSCATSKKSSQISTTTMKISLSESEKKSRACKIRQ